MNRFFAPGEEFSRIEALFPAERFRRDARGPGDDAFVWEPAPGMVWVVTTDSSVEGVHYRLDWTSPGSAARKALAAAVSDVNAMGGRARHVFFSLGARRGWAEDVFGSIGTALREEEERHGFRIDGGDTVRLPDSSFFSFTVLGEVMGRPLLRSACRPGHRVYVSGSLGGSSAGLRALQTSGTGSASRDPGLLAAHLAPHPPLSLGPALAALDRDVAAIDISDGLSSELWHLARRSGCRLRVRAEDLPVHPALRWGGEGVREDVLHGGEEYQLLFTGEFSGVELARLNSVVPVTAIGVVEAGEGVILEEGGVAAPLEAGGWGGK